MLAGQAGVKDHTVIGAGAVVLAQGGVFGDVPAGAVYSGYPARPHRERLKMDAALSNLPDYRKRLRELERANRDLTQRNARLEKMVQTLAQKLDIEIEE
jgi:UDP-3-O-[3-hydroxymyristoyl] glucosamine N-acyltransferase